MSREFRRILFGTQGGFPLAQEDVEAVQSNLLDYLGMLAVSVCLTRENVLFSSACLHVGSNMTVTEGYVLLNGVILSCPAQNVAGTDSGKFWMVPESVTDTPLQFQDGSVHNTRELRTVKVIYADSQPAGGVRIADMVAYSTLVKNLIIPLIPTRISDLTGRSYNDLTDRPIIPTVITRLRDLDERSYDSLTDKPTSFDSLEDSGWMDLSGSITITGLTSKSFFVRRKNNAVYISMSIYGLSGGIGSGAYIILTLPEKYRPVIPLLPAFRGSSALEDLMIGVDGRVRFSATAATTAAAQTLFSYPIGV